MGFCLQRDESISITSGMWGSRQAGNWSSKLRAHILNNKQEAENVSWAVTYLSNLKA